jgi:glycosyltransferase involved in cell wall biosynthesis
VLLQGYPNLEYIIIDGGSTDGSVEIIKKYEPWLTYWVSEKDNGQSSAINKGFSLATGELAGWLNSDDIFFPGAINKVVTYWLSNEKPNALITGTKLKGDSSLNTISRLEQYPHTIEHLINKNIIEQPSTFYPVSLLREVGGIDERYQMSMDYDLWLRMAKQGADLIFLNEDLAITRIHTLAKTTRFQRRSLTEVMLTVWRNFHVVSEYWLKKFLTVWIVPEGLQSEFWKRFLYLIRDCILKLALFIFKIGNLLEHNTKIK